jgi:hypothetical protein
MRFGAVHGSNRAAINWLSNSPVDVFQAGQCVARIGAVPDHPFDG